MKKFDSVEEEREFRLKKSKLANGITLARLVAGFLLIPVTLLGGVLGALGFSIVFLPTDKIDGSIAKRNNAKTALGSILDPISDKVFGLVVLIVLLISKSPAGILLAGELAITGVNLCKTKKGRINQSSPIGKFKMWPLGFSIILAFVSLAVPEIKHNFEYFAWSLNGTLDSIKIFLDNAIKFLVPFALGTQAVTAYDYLVTNVKEKKELEENQELLQIAKTKKEYSDSKNLLISIFKYRKTLAEPDFYSLYEEAQNVDSIINKAEEYEQLKLDLKK